MTIVRTTYRYKRPPKKRKPNPAALTMPRIVTAKKPKPRKPGDPLIRRTSDAAPAVDTNAAAKDDRKSAIVTVRRRKHARSGDAPEMSPEEHKQRGDAADELFRKMKRWLAEKPQP